MIPQIVWLGLASSRGRHPTIVCAAPGAGEVDLRLRIDKCEWRWEILGDDSDCSCCVAGFLQLNGAAQAGDAGAETWVLVVLGCKRNGWRGGGVYEPYDYNLGRHGMITE